MTMFLVSSLVAVALQVTTVPADPSGHWEGTIQAESMAVGIHVDIARDERGQLAGTITIPSQQVKGLPLSIVAVDGSSVMFRLGNVAGDREFAGKLSADGAALAGDFVQTGHTASLLVTRKGAAQIAPRPPLAHAASDLEGKWTAVLTVGGRQNEMVLTIANRADGTAAATIANVDEGGIEVPVDSMMRTGANVTFDLPSVGVAFTAVLSADGSELAGTYTQRAAAVPLTFHRAAAAKP
jgi:hypothetical protein